MPRTLWILTLLTQIPSWLESAPNQLGPHKLGP